MSFHTHRASPIELNIRYKDEPISEATHTNFLGIILDSHCDWKLHIDSVCKKVSGFVFALRHLRQVASGETSVTAYHGYISSVLQYGLLLWGNSTHINKLFIMQKKCVRAMCGAYITDSCKPLFLKLKLLTLPCLYIKQLAIFVKANPELFTKVRDNRMQRTVNEGKLVLPKTKLYYCRRNAYVMAIKVFNKLPTNLRNLPLTMFKTELHKWLTHRVFYSMNEFFTYKEDIV
jgi:hypothetical protein